MDDVRAELRADGEIGWLPRHALILPGLVASSDAPGVIQRTRRGGETLRVASRTIRYQRKVLQTQSKRAALSPRRLVLSISATYTRWPSRVADATMVRPAMSV